ncbi:MAG: hypothetical protein E7291_09505 [Lachnospiraceae bacterium]|nr:hypothetical protein [Lachnospiraceae bacterium]
MHIAICDDNVADRKQMERLLKRESDKRMSTTGNIYADSFGNVEALLANPMQYNAFYIDICKTEGVTGTEVANALNKREGNALIVMCCSEINYRLQSFPDNVIFLDKPVKAEELSQSIDLALSMMAKAEPLIELRETTDTYYVREAEILYAVEDTIHTVIALADGRHIRIPTSALNFYAQVEKHPVFMVPSEKVVLNCRHISQFGFRKITMSDGTVFKVSGKHITYAKAINKEVCSQ